MKILRRKIFVTIGATFVMAACTTEPEAPPAVQSAPISSPRPQAPAAQVTPNPAPAPVARPNPPRPQQPPAVVNPLNDPKSLLAKRSIYYDFDESEIKAEFRPLIEAHAKYLREHPGARILIQGNCDERGSREYNIALGQRRSQRVAEMLSLLGVSSRQMEAVSLGEEKPKSPSHDEASWSENRRSDIVYQSPQ